MNIQPIAVTVREAVNICGISRAKLYELIRSGDLKIRKCGSRTLIRYEDLQNLIDALPTAEPSGGGDA